MFAIHNASGVKFRGSLEDLSKKKALSRRKRLRDSSFWDKTSTPSAVVAFSPSGNSSRYQRAEELYRRMLRVKIDEPMIHAHQVMSPYVYTLTPDDLIVEAMHRFSKFDVKQMPVVDENGTVISMVGERDILRFLTSENSPQNRLESARISALSPDEIVTAEPVASLRRVAKVLSDYSQSGIPIVDRSERLVGFISAGDILRALGKKKEVSLWC